MSAIDTRIEALKQRAIEGRNEEDRNKASLRISLPSCCHLSGVYSIRHPRCLPLGSFESGMQAIRPLVLLVSFYADGCCSKETRRAARDSSRISDSRLERSGR